MFVRDRKLDDFRLTRDYGTHPAAVARLLLPGARGGSTYFLRHENA